MERYQLNSNAVNIQKGMKIMISSGVTKRERTQVFRKNLHRPLRAQSSTIAELGCKRAGRVSTTGRKCQWARRPGEGSGSLGSQP
jgi:hypothetical protein